MATDYAPAAVGWLVPVRLGRKGAAPGTSLININIREVPSVSISTLLILTQTEQQAEQLLPVQTINHDT
jgi:hypothetical protein